MKSVTVSIVSPSICHEVMRPDIMILAFHLKNFFKPAFSLSSFIFIKDSFVPLAFCLKDGVICISEVIDVSPSNLDTSLCFIQAGMSHDVLCI